MAAFGRPAKPTGVAKAAPSVAALLSGMSPMPKAKPAVKSLPMRGKC